MGDRNRIGDLFCSLTAGIQQKRWGHLNWPWSLLPTWVSWRLGSKKWIRGHLRGIGLSLHATVFNMTCSHLVWLTLGPWGPIWPFSPFAPYVPGTPWIYTRKYKQSSDHSILINKKKNYLLFLFLSTICFPVNFRRNSLAFIDIAYFLTTTKYWNIATKSIAMQNWLCSRPTLLFHRQGLTFTMV